jgi:hypothetical protein
VLASASENIQQIPSTPEWKTILDVSWVKPNDLFGRTYYLSVKDKFYVWPIEIDADNKRAMFTVNTSLKSRKSGIAIIDNVWISEGQSHEFEFESEKYKLNLVDIRNAGKIPSKATYVTVEQKK